MVSRRSRIPLKREMKGRTDVTKITCSCRLNDRIIPLDTPKPANNIESHHKLASKFFRCYQVL